MFKKVMDMYSCNLYSFPTIQFFFYLWRRLTFVRNRWNGTYILLFGQFLKDIPFESAASKREPKHVAYFSYHKIFLWTYILLKNALAAKTRVIIMCTYAMAK